MSSQRPVRPEDLKPKTSSSSSDSSLENQPNYPAGGPDPPEVAAMEEPMVPTLSITSYLALATAMLTVLPRLRSGRFISELMNIGIYTAPVLLAGYGAGVWGPATIPSTELPPPNVVSLPFGSSTATALLVLTAIAGAVLWIWLKSMVDAKVYSLLRGAVSGSDSSSHPGPKKTLGFFAANLMQFALATGVALFVGPVILRMITRTLVTHDIGLGLGLVLPLAIGLILLTWVRVLSMFISAWITWRPVFIAGALGAALAAPIRDRRMFWGGFALLSPLVAVSGLAVTLCAVGAYVPTMNVDVPPLFLQICLVGTFVTLMQIMTWFDIGLVASVGHQVGEFAIARTPEEAKRLRTAALLLNLESPEQEIIRAAPAGLFRASEPQYIKPISFAEVLPHRPIEEGQEAWASEQPVQNEAQPTSSGGQEVSLRFEDAADAPVSSEPAATVSMPAAPVWVAPDLEEDADAPRGLARLQESLLPVTLRTTNGLPERRYTGYRAPRQRVVTPAPQAPLEAEAEDSEA